MKLRSAVANCADWVALLPLGFRAPGPLSFVIAAGEDNQLTILCKNIAGAPVLRLLGMEGELRGYGRCSALCR